MDVPPLLGASLVGLGAKRPPSLGTGSTPLAAHMEPTQLCQGRGLWPCQRLAQINKQIPWICGFFSPTAPVRGEKRDPL